MADKTQSTKPVVMVVEDDEATRRLYQFLLANLKKYDMITAASSPEALKELRSRKVDVIVVNYQVDASPSQVNGLQFTQTIKQASPSTQVIMLATFDQPGLEGNAKKAGVDHYLVKPFDFNTLEQVIEKALSA